MIVQTENMPKPFKNGTVGEGKEVAISVLPPILVCMRDIIKRVRMINL
jgi:hypothetical protein